MVKTVQVPCPFSESSPNTQPFKYDALKYNNTKMLSGKKLWVGDSLTNIPLWSRLNISSNTDKPNYVILFKITMGSI